MNYKVLKNGWIDGKFCNEGAQIKLSDRQAKYHVMAGRVTPLAEGAEAGEVVDLPPTTIRPVRQRRVVSSSEDTA